MYCHTDCRQWAMQLLQYIASLPGGSRQCNSFDAVPQRLPLTRPNRGAGQWNSGNAGSTILGHRESCPRGGRCLKSGIPAVRCLTTQGQWAVELLTMHCLTVWGQGAVEVMERTASPPGGGGR